MRALSADPACAQAEGRRGEGAILQLSEQTAAVAAAREAAAEAVAAARAAAAAEVEAAEATPDPAAMSAAEVRLI